MTENLTPRQREILDFIQKEISRRGIPPTVREIADRFGMTSPNGAQSHVNALIKKGFLRKEAGLSRGLNLIKSELAVKRGKPEPVHENRDSGPDGYPMLGVVAAGGPILAVQEDGNSVTLDDAAGARPGDFLLRIKGNSMTGAGINPGDVAVVRPTGEAANGEIIVAMVWDEEATVKRFQREGDGTIKLIPENPDYEPIIIDIESEPFRIVGRVVGILRKY